MSFHKERPSPRGVHQTASKPSKGTLSFGHSKDIRTVKDATWPGRTCSGPAAVGTTSTPEKLRHTNGEAAAALACPARYRTVAGNLRLKEVAIAPAARVTGMTARGRSGSWSVGIQTQRRGL